MRYLKNTLNRKVTPQNQPIPGSAQVPNSAGGYSFALGDWERLERFLILGSEGGSYYASEKALTLENATVVQKCVKADGERLVKTVAAVSDAGRAPKNDPAIFALAVAAAEGDEKTRKAALAALPTVCRTGTHLFHFAQFVDGMRGWGRGLRRAVADWYTGKDTDALAYQAVKYQQRDGWSHRDLLRLAHPKPESETRKALYHWVTQHTLTDDAPAMVHAFEKAKASTDARELAALIRESKLPREAIPTQFLNERVVWEALLHSGMPLTALLRNLATMTRIGLFEDREALGVALDRLTDEGALRKARVHPVAVLSALKTYESGRGVRGQHTWKAIGKLVDALDSAFYKSFDNVEPTGKRYVLALDVSGSMGMGMIGGVPGLTPRDASAAMALVTAKTESDYRMVAFQSDLTELSITPRQRLDDVVRRISNLPFGSTDCAQPMLWALKNRVKADVFVVYTDSETWSGSVHPTQALRQYRDQMGIPAKLIVVGMVSNGFTIADPNDAGMLDIVGFDTAAPNLMATFGAS